MSKLLLEDYSVISITSTAGTLQILRYFGRCDSQLGSKQVSGDGRTSSIMTIGSKTLFSSC